MTDVPTLTSATAANYAVLNVLNQGLGAFTASDGNLKFTHTSTNALAPSTIVPTTGKWYCEIVYTTTPGYGIVGVVRGADTGYWYTVGVGYRGNSGNKIIDGTDTAYGASFTTGDVLGIALNLDAGTVTFYKNNSSQGAITLPSSTSGWTPYIAGSYSPSGGTVGTINFGQQPFAYTPPTGYVALNAYNL
jgi:hypothetical protein